MNDFNSFDLDIRIEFIRGEGDPTRIFRSMTSLINIFQEMDGHLAPILGAAVKTSLILEDVESSSLKSKLRTVIESIPDEPLKNADIKKLIGHFLLMAKHKIIDWCNDVSEISDRNKVVELERVIELLAAETNIKIIPAYGNLSVAVLLKDIKKIKDATDPLNEGDHATFSSFAGISSFNKNLIVSDELINKIIAKERYENKSEKIIKVKRPDYLGNSKWTFKYGENTIEVKIRHYEWLREFQDGNVVLKPGDSLRVNFYEEIVYGYENEVVHTEYEILNVLEVVHGPKGWQSGFGFDD